MAALDRVAREAGPRIVAALAAHFRDIDLAEEAFAEACARAVSAWPSSIPQRPDAWLYRTAQRCALDMLRRRKVREAYVFDQTEAGPSVEDQIMDDANLIPDERLRLIFVCCHPAVAQDARAPLTLKVVCGLSTSEIARAFLLSEPTLAQRLVRAKRKIAEAGVPFEIPGEQLWAERLNSVLSTLEVAYSKAHEDAAGKGGHAGFGAEMVQLTAVLADLLPDEPDVLAFAALVRFAEARRPARLDDDGVMVPLAEQDPAKWDQRLIADADALLKRGFALQEQTTRLLRAGIHATWCTRKSLEDAAPWPKVLALYDALLRLSDDPITRLNRIVALAEVDGPRTALQELERLDTERFDDFLPYHAVRADILRRLGRAQEALSAYLAATALGPAAAEGAWLKRQVESLPN